jgi:hypothetical protein
MLHQYPANAPPLQVMLDLVGDESETAVILLQSNALVEVGATFELAQPKSAQDPHVVAELRSTVRKRLESETGSSTAVPRTAGELRGRARAIGLVASVSKRIRRPRNGEGRLKPPRVAVTKLDRLSRDPCDCRRGKTPGRNMLAHKPPAGTAGVRRLQRVHHLPFSFPAHVNSSFDPSYQPFQRAGPVWAARGLPGGSFSGNRP